MCLHSDQPVPLDSLVAEHRPPNPQVLEELVQELPHHREAVSLLGEKGPDSDQ